jgi:hypothetical protein
MSTTPEPGYRVTAAPYLLRPSAPRNLQANAGSLECLLTWNEPADARGVNGYNVYLSSETSLIDKLDSSARQYRVKLPANSKDIAFVSSVSAIGRESPKIPVQVSSNTDQYVETGTSGATDGSSAPTPPEYPSEPGGGRARYYY